MKELTKLLLDKLIEKMRDDKDTIRVYNREIYKGTGRVKQLSKDLKTAGDTLEKKSDGWIKRRYDKSGYHYIEVKI